MLKSEDGIKSQFSPSLGNIILALNDTATRNRLKNVFIKIEHKVDVISPASTYHHKEANKQ